MSKINVSFGVGHTKRFVPSVLTNFLPLRDENGKVIKIMSDVSLLRHQKDLEKKIGVDSVRRYLEKLDASSRVSSPLSSRDLSDDELFSLIEPKEINNLTDSYQYAKYLASRSSEVKDKYNKLLDYKRNVYGELKHDSSRKNG